MFGRYYWTNEKIIARVQEWEKAHGRPPKAGDWDKQPRWGKDAYPSRTAVINVFGSWAEMLREAGYVPRYHWDQKAVVYALLAWKRRNGNFPHPRDWKNKGDDHPCAHTVYRNFGTGERSGWAVALQVAGRLEILQSHGEVVWVKDEPTLVSEGDDDSPVVSETSDSSPLAFVPPG